MNVNEWTRQWAESKNLNFKFFPSIDSTNMECKRVAFSGADGFFLCFADHQTHGRGRFERSWLDHGFGSYLLSSWSFKVDENIHPLVTARLGLKTIEAVKKNFKIPGLSLKAPNDLYIGKKKTAGILTESVNQGNLHRLIVGLGLNVFESPSEQPLATCLASEKVWLETQVWFSFLNDLHTGFMEVARTSDQNGLDASERAQILQHLNNFEGLEEKYTGLTSDGKLSNPKKDVFWLEL